MSTVFSEFEVVKNRQLDFTRSLIAVFTLILLATFICFYKLDIESISLKDEFIHTSAAQSMWQRNAWWSPVVDGKIYANKPPLKMLATFIPLSIWGETNFAFRFWDASFGVLLTVVVFYFSQRLFRSKAVGYFSALSIFSCKSLIFYHGFRCCTQDSGMVLFLTLALFLAYLAFEKPADPNGRKYAILSGIFTGLAVMVKSFGGFLGVIIFSVYYLLANKFWQIKSFYLIVKSDLIKLCLLLAPALFMFGAHLVFLATHGGERLNVILGYELVNRLKEGYHNHNIDYFYLRQLFIENQGLPPEIFVLSTLFGLYMLRKDSGNRRWLFLLVWSLFPLFFYGCLASRQVWYMNPGLIGSCILVGALVGRAFSSWVWFMADQRRVSPWALLFAVTVFLVGFGRLAVFIGRNIQTVINTPSASAMSRAAVEIDNFRKTHPELKVLMHSGVFTERQNRVYLRTAAPSRARKIKLYRDSYIMEVINHNEPAVVIVRHDLARELIKKRIPDHFLFVHQHAVPSYWILSYTPNLNSTAMHSNPTRINAAEPNSRGILGFWKRVGQEENAIRWLSGSRGALYFNVPADFEMAHGEIQMNLVRGEVMRREPIKADVYLNQSLLGQIQSFSQPEAVINFNFDYHTWLPGTNIISVRVHSPRPEGDVARKWGEIFGIRNIEITVNGLDE